LQRVPGGAGGFDAGDVGGLGAGGGLDGEGGGAPGAVDLHRDVLVAQRVGFDRAGSGVSATPLPSAGRSLCARQLQRALLHLAANCAGLAMRRPGASPWPSGRARLRGGAEDVGQVVAHLALVGHAGQAAGAGQHAQQRHLGQADGAAAVVDQDDLVAGQGQLVAAAGAGAVDGGQELQAAVAR
jgi:hypothetical protein